MKILRKYLTSVPEPKQSAAVIASLAALEAICEVSPHVAKAILKELIDQRSNLKLIASENFSSLEVQLAMGNWMSDKYSEGHVAHRFYAGCENVDTVEGEAVELAKQIFGAEHAYVQPHSGADANLVAFWAVLTHRIQNKEVERLGKKSVDELTKEEYESIRQLLVNQKIMGMSLGSGGHLTHGYRHNVSAKIFSSVSYDVDFKTGRIDYAQLQAQVKEVKPLILIAGYSAYPRLLDFAKMREIADSVGATLMVDMAHFAGLVAGKVMKGNFNPIPYAHIVTSTTHKTLRGPRGGLVLCTNELKEAVNKGCPMVLGGPLPHVMAAKAIAFKEASLPAFSEYAHQIVKNSQSLADALMRKGVKVLTEGTDNHLLIVDTMSTFNLTGRQAETLLRQARLTVNRNSIPNDPNGPWYTSGVRLGTPAITTLGMKENEMEQVAEIFTTLLKASHPEPSSKAKAHVSTAHLVESQTQVAKLLEEFPLYPELQID